MALKDLYIIREGDVVAFPRDRVTAPIDQGEPATVTQADFGNKFDATAIKRSLIRKALEGLSAAKAKNPSLGIASRYLQAVLGTWKPAQWTGSISPESWGARIERGEWVLAKPSTRGDIVWSSEKVTHMYVTTGAVKYIDEF